MLQGAEEIALDNRNYVREKSGILHKLVVYVWKSTKIQALQKLQHILDGYLHLR